jgi:hypothetical protein
VFWVDELRRRGVNVKELRPDGVVA